MAIIAVAGGTGRVGRTIVETLVAAGKHEVKILSRTANPELSNALGVPIVTVDYSNIPSLTTKLEELKIHTIISAMSNYDDPKGNHPQEVELIRAADSSAVTKRMITSRWSAPYSEKYNGQVSSVLNIANAAAALQMTGTLEYTAFYAGFFLDIWGLPAVSSHMNPFTMVLDMANNAAAIPGSGNVPVVFTHTTDIARFVAASLDLEKWDAETFVMGDKMTFNEALKIAEIVKGSKFNVVYDDVAKMKSGKTNELPGQVPMYSFMPKDLLQYMISVHGVWFEEGVYNLNPRKFLNDKFPEIKTIKVKELLEAAWGKA